MRRTTILKYGAAFLLTLVLLCGLCVSAGAAASYTVSVTKASGSYTLGGTVTMSVKVSGGAFEGADVSLNYTSGLTLTAVSTESDSDIITRDDTNRTLDVMLLRQSALASGAEIATLTFTVTSDYSADTVRQAVTVTSAAVCEDLTKDAVSAGTSSAYITLTPPVSAANGLVDYGKNLFADSFTLNTIPYQVGTKNGTGTVTEGK